MAKKKASINKSQLIRDQIAAKPKDGPKAIVAALKKKGIKNEIVCPPGKDPSG